VINSDLEIILVEDSPRDIEMTVRALRKGGVANQVTTLRDGEEALEHIFEKSLNGDGQLPRVIFLDLKLPKVDGFEVLKRLKADERTRHIPVVIVTSSAEERDLVETYKLGANSYVVKPIDFEQFANTISHLGFYWLAVNHAPDAPPDGGSQRN
jgi:CheY-like chemotaxis protein